MAEYILDAQALSVSVGFHFHIVLITLFAKDNNFTENYTLQAACNCKKLSHHYINTRQTTWGKKYIKKSKIK